jgi:hypothetical protein
MLNEGQGTLLSVQKAVVQSLKDGLFVVLNQHRQLALCSLLLEVGSNETSTVSFIGIILWVLVLIDVPAIVGEKSAF